MIEDGDLYAVLGVSRTASTEEIKSAYRALARQHHPDLAGSDPMSVHLFRSSTEAYNTLSDPDMRQKYDERRQPNRSVRDFLFNHSAGAKTVGVLEQKGRAAPHRGMDVVWPVAVTDRRIERGEVITVTVPIGGGMRTLPIAIPPRTGHRWIRLPQLGEPGANGGPNGDLWIFLTLTQPEKT